MKITACRCIAYYLPLAFICLQRLHGLAIFWEENGQIGQLIEEYGIGKSEPRRINKKRPAKIPSVKIWIIGSWRSGGCVFLCDHWPERRHGSARVPGHDFIAWRSSWQMVVYVYYITSARNSISSQLGNSCQGKRYGTEKADCAVRPSRTKSHPPDHSPPACRGGPPCWTSPLAFGLIGHACP